MSSPRGLMGWVGLCGLASMMLPSSAWSHAIAERYDLPVPLGFYVFGAVAVVAVTFLIAVVFVYSSPREGAERPLLPVGWVTFNRALVSAVTLALQILGVVALISVVATGLIGNPHPARNLAPTLVWIMWWCAFSIFVACVGNVWPALNPWRTLFALVETRRGATQPTAPVHAYPDRGAEWPAVLLLLIFVWLELISPFSSSPMALAVLAIAYSVFTFAGMFVFGSRTWLKRGEVFSLVFDVLSRFAPIGVSHPMRQDAACGTPDRASEVVVWRSWSAALLRDGSQHSLAMIALVLLLLSSVLFDGLLGTGLWREIEPSLPSDRGGLIASTYGLIGTWAFFLLAYLITAAVMSRILGSDFTTRIVASHYLLTLVPIAVGYNIAHNFSYIILQSQTFIALMSDPFGFGWNLLGTARWEPDLETIDAREIWYVAIGAIVVGHIIAVYLAHVVALRTAPTHKLAIYSLIPMTILMLLYTGASLSILAEPIVRFSMPDPGYS